MTTRQIFVVGLLIELVAAVRAVAYYRVNPLG